MKNSAALILLLVLGFGGAIWLSRWIENRRGRSASQLDAEQLYVSGPAAKRLTFAFNGLAADWYWMRSLQYVGRKVIDYEDNSAGQFDLNDLSKLDLNLLSPLLNVTTTLDPQFIPAYQYGAVILPELNSDAAISLLEKGIAANPSSWILYHHLGYIYWQRREYDKASDVYATGAKIAGAPAWMAAMSARMKADRGARDVAREIYHRLSESSNDKTVKEMVAKHLMRLDWLDDRDVIQASIKNYHSRFGHCPSAWSDLVASLHGTRIRIDETNGWPVDPSVMPYRLINGGCDIDLDEHSTVPR